MDIDKHRENILYGLLTLLNLVVFFNASLTRSLFTVTFVITSFILAGAYEMYMSGLIKRTPLLVACIVFFMAGIIWCMAALAGAL